MSFAWVPTRFFFFYDLLNSEKMLILQAFTSTISTQLLFKQTAIRVRVFKLSAKVRQ